jgi:hypothetical protein
MKVCQRLQREISMRGLENSYHLHQIQVLRSAPEGSGEPKTECRITIISRKMQAALNRHELRGYHLILPAGKEYEGRFWSMRQMTKPAVIAAALASALKIDHSHVFVNVKQKIGLSVDRLKAKTTALRNVAGMARGQ